jgi:hypothetical protein
MTCRLPHTTFNRSGLVRLLSEFSPEIAPKYDFGERLGQWLDFSDALVLFSALNQTANTATLTIPGTQAAPLSVQLQRTRAQLSAAILADGVFGIDNPRHRFPTPLPDACAEVAADYSPYHHYYLAHQRDMSSAIDLLRKNTRKALMQGTPAQRQLADIDASFAKALAIRERNLLVNIPILLARRFEQRYQAHRTTLPAGGIDDTAQWIQPGSWLEAFCHDTQTMLLAELDLRLKPVAGLIAALGETEPTC